MKASSTAKAVHAKLAAMDCLPAGITALDVRVREGEAPSFTVTYRADSYAGELIGQAILAADTPVLMSDAEEQSELILTALFGRYMNLKVTQ